MSSVAEVPYWVTIGLLGATPRGQQLNRAMKVGSEPLESESNHGFFFHLEGTPPHGLTPQVTPQFAPQVTPQVLALLQQLSGEMTRQELSEALRLKDRKHFEDAHLQPALEAGLLQMTNPGKPQSSNQRYRLAGRGHDAIGEGRS